MPTARDSEDTRWPAPHPFASREGDDVDDLDIHIEVDVEEAGAFVAEEMRHKRSEKHGRMTGKQAVAIGLSKAREAGINVPRKKRASG